MTENLSPDLVTEQPAADLSAADDAALGAIWDKAQAEGLSDDQPDTPDPVRGADGKFAKAQGEAADSLEGEAEAAVEVGPTPSTAAPAHMPQNIKASWGAIPEDARKAIVEHQQAMDRRFSEIGRQMEQSRPIVDRLTQATTQYPQFAGMSPEQLAQGALELAAVQSALEGADMGGRVNTILQIAQHYGVLPHLAAQVAGGNIDPRIFNQPLIPQQQQVSPQDIEAKIADALRQRDSETVIDSFAKSKPLFAEVEATMPAFVQLVRDAQPQASLQDVLEAAYDMAINANPTTRQKVRDLEAKVTTPAPDTKRADAARKAASINVKPSINGKERQPSEEEAMAAAYDRAMAN